MNVSVPTTIWQSVSAIFKFASGAFWASVVTSQNSAKQQPLPTDDMVRRTWVESFTATNTVNGLIDGMLGSPLTGNARNYVLGEAYFLRAVLYFNAVRIWGAVPLRYILQLKRI
jgi:hypothetical protein